MVPKNHLSNDKQETKQSQALSQGMVEAFVSLFKGRKDKSGWLRDEATANYIVLPNDKNPEPASVTLDLYRYHLLGRRWLGILPLVGDRCWFAATDLDEKDFQKALAIRDTLMEFGLKTYIAETKHKGYRILTFFDEPQLARDVRLVLEAASSPRGGESK